VSISFVNNQFQVAPFGTNVADADESNAAQLWSTVCLSIPDPLARVSPLVKGLSHVESCGELAAMVDIKPRWTYIDCGGLKAMRNEIGALSLTRPRNSCALRRSDGKAILPIGIEKNAHSARKPLQLLQAKKAYFCATNRRMRQTLIGARESPHAPGHLTRFDPEPGCRLSLNDC
jgi:hypothetical protein